MSKLDTYGKEAVMDGIAKSTLPYFLGMDLGDLLEAARAVLLDEEAEKGRFVLSRACALLFLKELSGLSSFHLEANCKTIGL